ncbi:uncharacterized protein PHALS_00984 [Plasmopara halstedii]|uniref:Uncharacterized protein n=1 Tax=Plasmopara halstedii TaxID=4781 RepID=A0A0P1ATL2_PLAHL|nr:uncharacterized protein PHALS_00984 [Plasmopara halstedii]CEG44638.1 hypothetical protein PHALS_00984 [Plasmopara halstedii]|eukprot:XP_024581007.1 hypothetical protein PHALS_00984 [Plasmopara halstedii]
MFAEEQQWLWTSRQRTYILTVSENPNREEKKEGHQCISVAKQPHRKSPRTAASDKFDEPQVVVEQLGRSRKKLYSGSDTCRRSSAAFAFAIFEVALPRDKEFVRYTIFLNENDPMSLDAFDVPGALDDQGFEHACAIIWSGTTWFSPLCQPVVYLETRICPLKGEYQWDIVVSHQLYFSTREISEHHNVVLVDFGRLMKTTSMGVCVIDNISNCLPAKTRFRNVQLHFELWIQVEGKAIEERIDYRNFRPLKFSHQKSG